LKQTIFLHDHATSVLIHRRPYNFLSETSTRTPQQKNNIKAYYFYAMATIEKGTGTIDLCAFDKSCELKKHEFGRPAPGPNDVAIDNKFCGMCAIRISMLAMETGD
jgi:hypothetical protein